MSYLGRFGIAAAVGLTMLATGAQAETNLRLAVETTPGDPTNIMLAAFRDELKAIAGDAVTIEFFDGGAIGDENALPELLRVNEVQVVPLGSDAIVQLDSKFALFDAPFLFKDKATARNALDGELGDLLKASFRETANLEVIAFGELGFRAISNNARPINVPADLAGLKLRTPSSAARIMMFKTLGAAPTPMPLGDTYVALRQGVLDGQENPLSVIKEFSLFEVQKYISLTNHVYTPITLAMNGQTWNALDDDLKQKVLAAAQAAAEKTRELSDKSDAELAAEFESAGVAINTPDIAAFQAAAEPIHAEIGKMVGEDFMAKAKSLIR